MTTLLQEKRKSMGVKPELLSKVVRPISQGDVQPFIDLIHNTTIGLTSLPKNDKILKEKVILAADSFAKEIQKPSGERYLFVMEDLESNRMIGCCGVDAQVGYHTPFYFFKQEEHLHHLKESNIDQTVTLLTPTKDNPGSSSLCSLFLIKEFRRGGVGRLLSFSRFIYMAQQPQRFTKNVTAELRGKMSPQGESPFYDAIMRPFIGFSLREALDLYAKDKKMVESILPKHAIYLELLSKEVQESVRVIHPNTEPAFRLLKEQGFQMTNFVDLFDGGPQISCPVKEIRTVSHCTQPQVVKITPEIFEAPYPIVGTDYPETRIAFGSVKVLSDHQVILSEVTAKALKVSEGDTIYLAPA